MYCKYCAAQIDDDSLVCSACGKPLGQSISSPIPAAPVMMPQSQVGQMGQNMAVPPMMPQQQVMQPQMMQPQMMQPQMMQQPQMVPGQQPMMQPGYQPQYQQPMNIVINNSSNATANNTNNIGSMNGMVSDKSKVVALLLCIFLGYLGIHRFYVGKIGTGLLYMFTGGLLGVGVLIDLIMIIIDRFRDRYGRFVMV